MPKSITLLLLFSFSGPTFSRIEHIPDAYHIVADKTKVPVIVLFSIALQESGRKVSGTYLPWPWTLNVENESYYFSSRIIAENALKNFVNIKKSKKIAVGVGQIYLPSHGHMFRDPVDILDPATNLFYSANILATEYRWLKRNNMASWWMAAGRYHTPSRPDLARTYRDLVFNKCTKYIGQCDDYGEVHL